MGSNSSALNPGIQRLTPKGLPSDQLEKVPHRLFVVSVIGAVLLALLLIAEPFRGLEYTAGMGLQVGVEIAALIICIAMAWLARSERLPIDRLVDVGLLFEVAIGAAVWVLEFSVPFAAPSHTPGVPSVCVWLLIFPIIVPATSGKATLAALSTAALGPVVLFTFIALGQEEPEVLRAALWFSASFICAFVAVAAAQTIHQLTRAVVDARMLGSYRLKQLLGRGGMGEVWRAHHELLARPAAVKMIRRERLGQNEESTARNLRRFEREAKVTAALRSPHTVELFDYGFTEDGDLYYVMELLEGVDLERLVIEYGPQPSGRIISILKQACESLAEAHGVGLVHRDIKPANLMLCRMGTRFDFVKVLDFGLVKDVITPEDSDTHDGVAVGTPAFMAPDVVGDRSTHLSDIYALGCVAYWLMTGRLVFEADGAMAVIVKHVNEAPIPPSERVETPTLPALEALVMQCLEKDPSKRPPSVLAMRTRLAAMSAEHAWLEEDAEAWWSRHLPDLAKPLHSSLISSADRKARAPTLASGGLGATALETMPTPMPRPTTPSVATAPTLDYLHEGDEDSAS